ncbi:MAG: hypothetical protein A4E53_00134 [Pelotomaculum sp. PtaB.Bin104]|nr:MAG: hypothetical protein A4E53_00134 [Pelotomaculum sp. PtaB.Bin104]
MGFFRQQFLRVSKRCLNSKEACYNVSKILFYYFGGDDILFVKKDSKVEIKKMTPSNDFEVFARPIRERFQKEGITPEHVEAAINWARGKKNESYRGH